MSRNLQTKKEINEIIEILKQAYPEAKCRLNYESPLQLVVALILAAQCTDDMVNKVVPILFNKYPSAKCLANADLSDIEKIVRPCGFYLTKAKNIQLTARSIFENYNNTIPDSMEELTKLYGIGRKSSNIILQECYNKTEGIAVDTHVSRTSKRIGFTRSDIPLKQEQELIKKVDKKYFNKLNHILVFHGRAICISRKPKCDICPIEDRCKKVGI
ncbi:MAG: Endonuclease [Clostridia bacterium]|jgi:endonuclease-3|nr:Endonuclease [Clostridia bacterium]